MNKATPIFIISLPRSGSTLLQRILTSHESVASASEPWLLLPLIEMIGSKNIESCANYSKLTSQLAAVDFYSGSEKGMESFYEAVQLFLNHGYESYCNNDEAYFIDKTPRYYLIIDEIYKVFPNAKCIFILRNPLEVMASMIKTWHNGEFKLHHHYIDLYKGVDCLYQGCSRHKGKILSLTYDELVNNSALTIQGICDYLDVKYDSEMTRKFSEVNLSGRMGDSVGVRKYFELSGRKNDDWRKVLSSPVRKWYCKRYINYFSDDVWSAFGLTRKAMLEDVSKERIQYSSTIKDMFWLVTSPLLKMFSPILPRGRLKKSVSNRDFHD